MFNINYLFKNQESNQYLQKPDINKIIIMTLAS